MRKRHLSLLSLVLLLFFGFAFFVLYFVNIMPKVAVKVGNNAGFDLLEVKDSSDTLFMDLFFQHQQEQTTDDYPSTTITSAMLSVKVSKNIIINNIL